MNSNGKLPQSLDAERGLLGSILLAPTRVMDEHAWLQPEDFYHPSHVGIFEQVRAMLEARKPIDLISLSQWLDDRGMLNKVGGATYVTELFNFVPTATNAKEYGEIIREKAFARRAIAFGKEVVAVASNPEERNLSERIQAAVSRVKFPETNGSQIPKPLIKFGDTPPDPTKTLLGNRFLCVEGGMLFVGPSGIGKTSASIQQDLLWSVGQPAFGIMPAKPLKILTIQAEDDDGDLSEIVSGVKGGLQFTPEQCEQSAENCFYVVEKSHTGIAFLEKIVRPLLAKHRLDLLRLNPFHAYLGGDVKDTKLTADFLRNHLNPLLAEFQCACIIVHHTPKVTFRDTKEWKASDWMYAGAGAADITNWCRAALIIDSTTNPRVFQFIAAKRASRIGWEDDLTSERQFIRHFAHDDNGSIYWREADEKEVKEAGKPKREAKDIMIFVPEEGSTPKDVLLAKAGSLEIGVNKARAFLSILIADGELFEWKISRPRTNPAIHVARYEQPIT